MNADHRELRAEALGPSVWRLGDVLDDLLVRYGLTESCRLPDGGTGLGGEVGLFSTTDLPAIATSTY
jgi:hypothetical protein